MDHAFHSHESFVGMHSDCYITFPSEHWLPCFQVVGFTF
jgi:hypothetical protein